MSDPKALILWLDQVRNSDVASVGGKNASLRGQAPSDHPDFAELLVACGID